MMKTAKYPDETFEQGEIFLRRMRVEDAESEYEMFGDPEYTWFLGRTFSLEDIQKGIQKEIDDKRFSNGLGKWIIIQKNGNEKIGSCSLVKVKNQDEIEIGYFLKKNYWGKGLATAAALLMMEHGFVNLKHDEIVLRIHPLNHASVRVAEKLKFRSCGAKEYPDENVTLLLYKMNLNEYKTYFQRKTAVS